MFKSFTLLLLLATSQAVKVRSTTHANETCDWKETNGNTDGEEHIGDAASASECLAMVKEQCPWAAVANIGNGHGDGPGDCWCQNAFERHFDLANYDDNYQSCFVAGEPDVDFYIDYLGDDASAEDMIEQLNDGFDDALAALDEALEGFDDLDATLADATATDA